MVEFLSRFPFNLSHHQISIITDIYENLSQDQRISQVFMLMSFGNEISELESIANFQPGGMVRVHGQDLEHERAIVELFIQNSTIPPLIAKDLEGGRQSFSFGTRFPNQIGLSAIDDKGLTEQIACLMADEAKALGIRWSFSPVIDINAAFRSAIVGTRSYGSDVERIERHASAHIRGLQQCGVAATVKHWPGEGFDDRDQHLLTTVNPLSLPDWERTFAKLYRSAIQAGVMAVMVGHIAFPAYTLSVMPNAGVDAFRPASLNNLVIDGLLRNDLGFNGIVISDATAMAGLGSWANERQAMPQLLAAGCDMILHSSDPIGDRLEITRALEDGRLTDVRLREAVMRVLGLKCWLGLLEKSSRLLPLSPLSKGFNNSYSRSIAEKAFSLTPTLEKDVNSLLPLRPEKHRRIALFQSLPAPIFGSTLADFIVSDLLREEGFEVVEYSPGLDVNKDDFDLVIYLVGEESALAKSHIFLDWRQLSKGDLMTTFKRYWHEIPSLMISFGHPYYLYDAPRIPTYINGWSNSKEAQRAVVNCLLGRVPWKGGHPVDAFCGLPDAHW